MVNSLLASKVDSSNLTSQDDFENIENNESVIHQSLTTVETTTQLQTLKLATTVQTALNDEHEDQSKSEKESEKKSLNQKEIPHEKIITMQFDALFDLYKDKAIPLIRKHLLIEINKFKEKNTYTSNSVLQWLAQEHADDMQKNSYYSHTDLLWKSPLERATGKYSFTRLTENMVPIHSNIEGIMYLFANSTSHKKIFSEEFKELGIGISQRTPNGTYYVVVDYAHPLPEKK